MVTGEEPIVDEDTEEVIGTAYTVTGYYNVIEVSENATKGHDGHLEVETEEGLGTRFKVQLPIV